MRFHIHASVALTAAALTLACANASPTRPSQATDHPDALASLASSALRSNGASSGSLERAVSMMDACDGPTFNLIIGPGTCSRPHGVNFSEFVAELTARHEAGAWHFGPSQTDAFLGDTMVATNKGGEVHTFTRVAAFGGGLVPFLNDLTGAGGPVPECFKETNFVQPGGTDTDSLNKAGELKFQCCIHPWMRTTVLVKSH
jgi:plastocyanin